MTDSTAQEYFVYLPENPNDAAWGCSVTSIGFTRVAPGSPYPPQRHPDDHHFTWSRGRILQAHQIIMLSEGRGRFEFGKQRRELEVAAGDVFVLFPGVWHRYAPDLETGWIENWIEMRGPAVDRAMARCVAKTDPLIRDASGYDLQLAFDRCHQWARQDALRNQPLLSTLGLHMIALLGRASSAKGETHPQISEIVARAQMLMLERSDSPVNVESLAEELNVGYSYFRKAFRAETGMSPKQFHLRVRLQKAKDFLANTEKSLKQIAEILGFNSQFHLSSQFKAEIGSSPSEWRRTARQS